MSSLGLILNIKIPGNLFGGQVYIRLHGVNKVENTVRDNQEARNGQDVVSIDLATYERECVTNSGTLSILGAIRFVWFLKRVTARWG